MQDIEIMRPFIIDLGPPNFNVVFPLPLFETLGAELLASSTSCAKLNLRIRNTPI